MTRQQTSPASVPSQVSSGKGETNLDWPILLATLAVLLAISATEVANLGSLAVFVLVLSVLYNLVVIGIRWKSVVNDLSARQGFMGSIALEGFLIGLLAFVLIEQKQLVLRIVTGFIMLVALILFFASRYLFSAIEEAQRATRRTYDADHASQFFGETQIMSPRQPAFAQLPPMNPGINIIPSNRKNVPLPLLFQDDPLYSWPEPSPYTRYFVVAKNNDDLVKCEDACALSDKRRLYALSDGTSNSQFPRPWAALLAQKWIRMQNEELKELWSRPYPESWLRDVREEWKNWVGATWLPGINKRNATAGVALINENVVDDILAEGAAATFLGLLLNLKAGRWTSIACGDTNLFLLRRESKGLVLHRTFPLQRAADFNSAPSSLSSVPYANLETRWLQMEGSMQPGDIFLLATDALATWILQRYEQGDLSVWSQLLRLQNNDEFSAFVNQMRNKRQHEFHMNDDDTTLMIIETDKLLRN